jgi:transposase
MLEVLDRQPVQTLDQHDKGRATKGHEHAVSSSVLSGGLGMAGQFWLSDVQWAVLEPLLPTNQPGARRTDDRRVISGIVHMLRNGGRWQDCPSCYGPPTTIYNRYHRWSGRGIWQGMLARLIEATPGGLQLIDSTTARAHRSASGGKGGPTPRP